MSRAKMGPLRPANMPEIDLEWTETVKGLEDERLLVAVGMALSELNDRCKDWQVHCLKTGKESMAADCVTFDFAVDTEVLNEVLTRLQAICQI